MSVNQSPLPREWLMTDERIGTRLWDAIDALPDDGGVVFRHYATPRRERGELAALVAQACARRGLTLAIAGDVRLASHVGAALLHNPIGDPGAIRCSRSAHSAVEAGRAAAAGASLIFLSPIFPTRSHPGRDPLSRDEVRSILASCAVPIIALGGMNRARFADLRADGFYGWAGIDAWLGDGIRI